MLPLPSVMLQFLNCCLRPSRTKAGRDGNNSSEGETHDLGSEAHGIQRNDISAEKGDSKEGLIHERVSLAQLQRVVSTIAGNCEEAWLYRVDAALSVVQEHFDAESVSLYTVYDGGLSFATLSACGVGAGDLPRGLPYSLTQDLSSSVAVLLTSQTRCSTTTATPSTAAAGCSAIRASAPPASPAAASLPGSLDSLPTDWQRLNGRHGLRHFISAPLVNGELMVGALTLASRRGSLPPPCWQPDVLGLVAATLSLMMPQRKLSIATSIMTEIHLARNIDELVRAVRRGVYDAVVATTHLPPVLRLALIRADGSAAAVFEEQPQHRSSFTRLTVCSEATVPVAAGVPEMLQAPNTSRRSIDTGSRASGNQLSGQASPPPSTLRAVAPPSPPSCGGRTKSCVLPAEAAVTVATTATGHTAIAVAAAAANTTAVAGSGSDPPSDRGWTPIVKLQERIKAVMTATATTTGGSGSGGLGNGCGSSFTVGEGPTTTTTTTTTTAINTTSQQQPHQHNNYNSSNNDNNDSSTKINNNNNNSNDDKNENNDNNNMSNLQHSSNNNNGPSSNTATTAAPAAAGHASGSTITTPNNNTTNDCRAGKDAMTPYNNNNNSSNIDNNGNSNNNYNNAGNNNANNNNNINNSAQINCNKNGARGHTLSLANTLLGESLQKDCGLWISDCTLYLQEARTYPRDIVFSRGNRAVHSIAVCSGRHNGLPLLGAYCVYGAVLPRQLLRAVTLELEQLLKLLSPSVHVRLCSAALVDEWMYLHEELLNPARVDPVLRRQNRLSASLAPDFTAEGSPVRTPGSPPSQLTVHQVTGENAAAAAGGSGGDGEHPGPPLPLPAAVPQSLVTAMRASEQLYQRGTSVEGAPLVMAAAGAGANAACDGGAPLASRLLLSGATPFGDNTEVDSPGVRFLPVQEQPAVPLPVPALRTLRGVAGAGVVGDTDVRVSPILTSLRALGMTMKSSPGTSRDAFLPPSLVDGMGQPAAAAAALPPLPLPPSLAGCAAGVRACSTGSASAAGAVLFVSSLLGSPGTCQDTPPHTIVAALGGGGGGGSRTTGSMMRTMLATPSFTVESVRSSLGGGLRRAPLVSGLHERLAAAQASRLVHGSAIEHQEELAAIEVLEKIGEGGYGEVYRGQYDGTEVAIKIVYEPHGNPSGTRSRLAKTNLQQGAATPPGNHATAVGTEDAGGPPTGICTAGGSSPFARGLHDAFELTVSVSVCHPNIVQVLTFFTDVYVHVERRGGSNTQLSSAPGVLRVPSPQRRQYHPHPHQLQQQQQQDPTVPQYGPYGGGGGGVGGGGHLSEAAAAASGRDYGGGGGDGGVMRLPPSQSAGAMPTTAGVSSPAPPRVTLLPYPNNLTSCQLNGLDVSGFNLAEYTALQAAMASNGSEAQQVLAGSPPAMVICMEYCDAGSLSDAIVRGAFRQPALGLYGTTQPNMKAVFATLLEVALALRHLHSLRLVHCDLKPSNVLLRCSARDPRGFTAKLSDFGLVRLMEPCGEGGRLAIPQGVTHGSVTHMAPEVLSDDKAAPHDASLDIYAFGIIMWQVVYGGRLYPGVSLADIPTRVALEGMRPRFISNVPSEYRRLAESCWAANPANRPTAAALVLALKELMGLGPRIKGQRRYSALAPQCKLMGPRQPPAAGGCHGPGSFLGQGVPFLFGPPCYAASDAGAMTAVDGDGGGGGDRDDGGGEGGRYGGGGKGNGELNSEEGGGGGAAANNINSITRPRSGGIRTRSLSYSGFPVHIL